MKKLAITMGDPGGVGPEVIVQALAERGIRRLCVPIVIGDARMMSRALRLLRNPLTLREIGSPVEAVSSGNHLHMISIRNAGLPATPVTKPTTAGGKASVRFIRKAVELAMLTQIDGIVTAPIAKEALRMAGLPWPGHTEMLAEMSHTERYAMMLVGGPLRIILVTVHAALRDVSGMITEERILGVIRLAKRACEMLRIPSPRIGVAGLNPHAGEGGMFGAEEQMKIVPAIRRAKRAGISVSGPYPPDTIFYKAYHGEIDIVVCMYHDQGLIPLKMIAFDRGVNVTVGLPFVRTSPDHGTAYDIAWKGLANPSSMIEAIKLAAQLKA
jgi:4-hydroxythreonine-4-phosphate dehydrogenase